MLQRVQGFFDDTSVHSCVACCTGACSLSVLDAEKGGGADLSCWRAGILARCVSVPGQLRTGRGTADGGKYILSLEILIDAET